MKTTLAALIAVLIALPLTTTANGATDRAFAVKTLTRIAEPVLSALAAGKLRQTLPVYTWENSRANYAPLEAFGRTLAGIAPWLELGPDDSAEGKLRAHFIDLSVQALANACDPHSPDFMDFNQGSQPLVDTAFLALGLLRAPDQLWGRLDPQQRSNVIAALKSARVIKPYENNWVLFSATIEAALYKFTGECEMKPVEYALQRHEQWYLGDGIYGDGTEFHWDYYNSYVIQPMLLAVTHSLEGDQYPKFLARAQRYAVVQERMISPEGTFPVIGRSSTYRFGAFHLLADMALLHELPSRLKPGSVRTALTAVIQRTIEAPGTFDAHGWLQIGAVGSQPSIRENYISTGSSYLCLCGLLTLGLPANDPFWTAPGEPWTQKQIWSGADVPADHAYADPK